MKMRLSKRQRLHQEEILMAYLPGEEFKSGAYLLDELAKRVSELKLELCRERAKSLWAILKERMKK
jgi:hypothetical protein